MMLETSFLVDYFKGKLDKSSFWENPCVASVSIMELFFGALKFGREREQTSIIDLMNSVQVLDFDQESAIEASRIMHNLTKRGLIVETEDIMIAAIAKTHDQALITRNPRHFDRIEGLRLQTY